MSTACCSINKNCPIDQWFPTTGSEKAKNIAIGIIAGLGCFFVVSGIIYVIQTHCTWFSLSQDAIKIFDLFKNAHPLIHFGWRAIWRGYVVLAGPLIEELIFRGFGHDKVKECQEKETTMKKVIRIAIVSLIFGACHLSPFQNGMSNLVIFGVTTLIGVVLSILKEQRKDLSAPLAAHIMYNLAATI